MLKLILVLLFSLSLFYNAISQIEQTQTSAKAKNESLCEEKPFFVLEFFAFEGCQSCAEVEGLFNSLVLGIKQSAQQPNVVAITEHISYFNKVEDWVDRFGLKENDSAQQQYCIKLNSQSYTPQVVMNGELIGPVDQTFIQKNMVAYLAHKPSTGLCLDQEKISSDSVTVNFKLSGVIKGCCIKLMLIEGNLKTNVSSGENKGKTLEHENLVRVVKYHKLGLNEYAGTIKISIPADAIKENVSIVGFVQNAKTLAIVAANKGFALR